MGIAMKVAYSQTIKHPRHFARIRF